MTLIDKACYERGCACYDSRVDNDGVEVVRREWVGLTDEEVNTIYKQAEVLVHDSWVGNGTVGLMFPITLYKMLEAKLKEKNT